MKASRSLCTRRETHVDSGLVWRVGTGLGTLNGDGDLIGLGDPKTDDLLSCFSGELMFALSLCTTSRNNKIPSKPRVSGPSV